MTLHNIILILILLLGNSKFLSCGSQTAPEPIAAVSLAKKTPIVMADNTLKILESYYNVYYHNDLVMYKTNYEFDSLFNGETVLREKRYSFLVFHKDSSYAYQYFAKPTEGANENQRVNKDSVLATNKFESGVFDTLINFIPDSIYKNKEGIIKVYKNPQSANFAQPSEKFDLYFYYSKKLKNIPETFSRKMDNEKGMKLVKIIVQASGGYYKNLNMTFQPREHIQEMKELRIENHDEIMNYFRKYQERKL